MRGRDGAPSRRMASAEGHSLTPAAEDHEGLWGATRSVISGAYEGTLQRTALLNNRLINITILKREESFGHMAKAGVNLSLES